MIRFCFLVLLLLVPTIANAKVLDFTFTSPNAESEFSAASIQQAYWEGDNLMVTILTATNCGRPMEGRAALEENTINFSAEGVDTKGPVALCTSPRLATFVVKNLEKKDYTIAYGPREKLLLKADNSVSDSCDTKPDLDCYSKNSMIDENPNKVQPKIIFETAEESKLIAGKYPKFPEYFLKEQKFAYNSQPEVYYLKFGYGQILSSDSTFKRDSSILLDGHSFEDAVSKFVSAYDTVYAPNGRMDQLQRKFNFLKIVWLGRMESQFKYNNEIIEYRWGGIKFLDRPLSEIEYKFKNPELPDLDKISGKEFLEAIKLADTASKLMENSQRIMNMRATLNIDRSSKIADFINVYLKGPTKFYTVHNRKIPYTQLSYGKVHLDLAKKEISISDKLNSLPDKNSSYPNLKDNIIVGMPIEK